MKKILDRKSFLKGALASVAGTAAAAIFPGNAASAAEEASAYIPGTYTSEVDEMDPLKVTMSFSENSVTQISIEKTNEAAKLVGDSAAFLAGAIMGGQLLTSGISRLNLPGISSATLASLSIRRAIEMCEAQAKGVDVEMILGDDVSGVPKRKVCANCNQPYNPEDRYCRFCGAPMGSPDYIEEDFAAIYGPPPVERIHICEKCGYSWTTNSMIDYQRYCPRCGGSAPAEVKEDPEWQDSGWDWEGDSIK